MATEDAEQQYLLGEFSVKVKLTPCIDGENFCGFYVNIHS